MAAVGPIAAEYLAWLGADVIKIEPPTGDIVRGGYPRFQGTAHTFIGNNLGKRGIVLDLKRDEDREAALQLIRTADVMLENFRSPDVMRRLGLDYETVAKVHPGIVYLSGSAYGPRGPMSGMTSNEWFSQASAGVTSLTGQAGGLPEFSRGTATLDWSGAATNLQALLVALWVRRRTGRGMLIYTSQYQSTIVASTSRLAEYFATGDPPRPMGSARPNIVPDQAFRAADGYIAVSVPHDGYWPPLCVALERRDLAADEALLTNAGRVEARERVTAELAATFVERDAAQWVERLREARVPCSAYQSGPTLTASLQAHPQAAHLGLVREVATPWGEIASAQPHWRFEKTPARIAGTSPLLGEHQQEVLRDLPPLPAESPARPSPPTGLALEGLRVVDISQGLAGPFCAMQLGDLGADVVKVEPPTGDWLRAIGPFQSGESALFLQANRNKRGLALDLSDPLGREAFEALLAGADVLVEGYRPGAMERLGLGHDDLAARFPRLVTCSISGWGAEGPLADQPATEIDIQAAVGSNRHLGRPDWPPERFGLDLASHFAALSASHAILAALLWRDRSGEGQHVATSLFEAFVGAHQWTLSAELAEDHSAGRPVTGLSDPPDHGFETADGPALITLRGDEAAWAQFLIAIDCPEVLSDPRYETPDTLMSNLALLPPLVNDSLRRWSYEDLRRLVQDELGGTTRWASCGRSRGTRRSVRCARSMCRGRSTRS
jgi:formyl-CoA transferase